MKGINKAGGLNVINREWNPRVQKTKSEPTQKRVELEIVTIKKRISQTIYPHPSTSTHSTPLVLRSYRNLVSTGYTSGYSYLSPSDLAPPKECYCFACSPKNNHFATLEAMNSVRKMTIMAESHIYFSTGQHPGIDWNSDDRALTGRLNPSGSRYYLTNISYPARALRY